MSLSPQDVKKWAETIVPAMRMLLEHADELKKLNDEELRIVFETAITDNEQRIVKKIEGMLDVATDGVLDTTADLLASLPGKITGYYAASLVRRMKSSNGKK